MARDLPPPTDGGAPRGTPEGQLIRRVRQSIRPRLTIADAAKRAGISEQTWGHMERGYKPGLGGAPPIPFSASEQTVAHAAFQIGIKPEDLLTVGRRDAAAVLAQMLGPDSEVVETPIDDGVLLIAVPPDLPEEDRELIRKMAQDLAAYLGDRRQLPHGHAVNKSDK